MDTDKHRLEALIAKGESLTFEFKSDRKRLPDSDEVAFQVLRGTDVQVNEFYRTPLIETFEEVEKQFLKNGDRAGRKTRKYAH